MFDCGENSRTPHGIARVWLEPSKIPLQDIVGRVLVSVHHESTAFTMIGTLPQGHVLPVATAGTLLGGVLLTDDL